jgi:hypothetical protein
MRIGLIAPENNGKTCYLVALYTVLVQEMSMRARYPLRFDVADTKQRYWFNDQLSRLCSTDLPLDQRLPMKTDAGVTDYVFAIEDRASGAVESISVVDFPGGVIRGYAQDSAEALHEETMDRLASCDAFIVLLDSSALLSDRFHAVFKLSPSDIDRVVRKAGARAPHEIYGHLGLPIAFCLSKSDKIARLCADDPDKRRKVYERVREIFPRYFDESYPHPVMVASVSLGEHIEDHPAGLPGMGGPFDPVFIETPFEFCAAFCAFSAMSRYNEKADAWAHTASLEAARGEYAKTLGFRDSLAEWRLAGARVGQSPQQRWEERQRDSLELERKEREKAQSYLRVIEPFIEGLRNAAATPFYSLYLGGKRHHVVNRLEPGRWPLAPAG